MAVETVETVGTGVSSGGRGGAVLVQSGNRVSSLAFLQPALQARLESLLCRGARQTSARGCEFCCEFRTTSGPSNGS